MLKVIDTSEFNELSKSKLAVFALCADWCGPCGDFLRSVGKVEKAFKDEICFASVDIDVITNIPAKYGVDSIPALLIFKEGKLVHKHIGPLIERKLVEYLNLLDIE